MKRASFSTAWIWTGFVVCLVVGMGCLAHRVQEVVYHQDQTQVLLRGVKQGRQFRDRGFEHPSEMTRDRLVQILASIQTRKQEQPSQARAPAVADDILQATAAALGYGLALAGPGQEVVVRTERSTGAIFMGGRRQLTEIAAHLKGEKLYLQFSRVDWPVPRPRPEDIEWVGWGEQVMRHHIEATAAAERVGAQTLEVEWRDPRFASVASGRREPEFIRSAPVHSQPDAVREMTELDAAESSDLSPEELRGLADLLELKNRGHLSAAEYESARQRILQRASSD